MWETLSGSLYLRFANPGLYQKILDENTGRTNQSTEDIEKDLHRSLPEYPAYQSEDGIGALRRVLQAYSFKNPDLGYCQVSPDCRGVDGLLTNPNNQAMNILAAAILMLAPVYYSLATPLIRFIVWPATCPKSKHSGCSTLFATVSSQGITGVPLRYHKSRCILTTDIVRQCMGLSLTSASLSPWCIVVFRLSTNTSKK